MAFAKILDFGVGSKLGVKLPNDISNDWESQICYFLLPDFLFPGHPVPGI